MVISRADSFDNFSANSLLTPHFTIASIKASRSNLGRIILLSHGEVSRISNGAITVCPYCIARFRTPLSSKRGIKISGLSWTANSLNISGLSTIMLRAKKSSSRWISSLKQEITNAMDSSRDIPCIPIMPGFKANVANASFSFVLPARRTFSLSLSFGPEIHSSQKSSVGCMPPLGYFPICFANHEPTVGAESIHSSNVTAFTTFTSFQTPSFFFSAIHSSAFDHVLGVTKHRLPLQGYNPTDQPSAFDSLHLLCL